jgi:hypothetical protein
LFAGKNAFPQQFPKMRDLLPKPFGPSEVTLAGTPGFLEVLPPKPKELTEAGTP